MKEPIEPEDIRDGDLIRWESRDGHEAREWREGQRGRLFVAGGSFYLLDRPKPVVELPTEPTLGRLHWTNCRAVKASVLAEWTAHARTVQSNLGHIVPVTSCDAFEPLTAVPTSALDELRDRSRCYGPGSPTSDFLAAVDASKP